MPVLGHVLRLCVRADRWTVAALMVLMAGQAVIVAGTGLSQRWLVDTAMSGRAAGVAAAVTVGALSYGLGAAGGRIQTNMLIYLTDRVQVALSHEVLRFTASIPTVDHLERPEYLDRVDRLRRGTWALASSFWQLVAVVGATVSLLVTAALLAVVHPALCLLALLAVPSLLASHRSARIMRDMLDSTAELSRWEQRLHDLALSFDAAKELAVSGAGAELDRRAEKLWRRVTAGTARAQVRASGWRLLGWLCFAAGFFAALWLLAGRVVDGATSLGSAVLVVTLASQLQGQLGQVVAGATQVAAAGHVIDHYILVRDQSAAARRSGTAPPQRLRDGIVLRDVWFRYPGAAHDALRGVDIRLPRGATVALVGVNGAGKTTLVKLLSGLYEPTQGSISVDGRPLREISPELWCRNLTAVFQDFARFQFRVRETVGVGDLRRLHDEAEIAAAVDRAGAAGLVAELPHRLETQLGAVFGGIEPSSGQWQKLALARAMMRRTSLLQVLDEPTAALDPQAEHEQFVRYTDLSATAGPRHGTITVVVSHRLSTVRAADLIVVLSGGRVVELGGHADLMSHDGQYARLYRKQAGGYLDEPDRAPAVEAAAGDQ